MTLERFPDDQQSSGYRVRMPKLIFVVLMPASSSCGNAVASSFVRTREFRSAQLWQTLVAMELYVLLLERGQHII